jgi:hypothetical protein
MSGRAEGGAGPRGEGAAARSGHRPVVGMLPVRSAHQDGVLGEDRLVLGPP